MPLGGGGAITDQSTGGIIPEGTAFAPGAVDPLGAMLGFGEDMEIYDFTTALAASTLKQIFGKDPRRWGVLISSVSTTPVQIGFSNKIAATQGIIIPANGGFVYFNFDVHGILVNVPIFAFTTAATTLYCVNVDFVPRNR